MNSLAPSKSEAFKRACAAHPVTGFADHRAFLAAVYGWLKVELKTYSYLAFAEDLGFSRTNVLYLIISGRRPLTVKAARRMSNAMQLPDLDRRFLETLVRRTGATSGEERNELSRSLVELERLARPAVFHEAQRELFSAWYHPVVLGMMALPGFRSDPTWIAATIRPQVTPAEAAASLALLERLGLAAYNADRGRHVPALAQVTAGDDVLPPLAPFQRQVMEIGLGALADLAPGEDGGQNFSSVIVGVSAAAEEQLKSEIRRFRQHLLDVAREGATAERVVQINLQLFPVSSRG